MIKQNKLPHVEQSDDGYLMVTLDDELTYGISATLDELRADPNWFKKLTRAPWGKTRFLRYHKGKVKVIKF